MWKKHIESIVFTESMVFTGHVVLVVPFRWVQGGNGYAGAPLATIMLAPLWSDDPWS